MKEKDFVANNSSHKDDKNVLEKFKKIELLKTFESITFHGV